VDLQPLTINVAVILDEYDYAREQYKKAFGDQQKDYWDGYLAAIEKLCGEVMINE